MSCIQVLCTSLALGSYLVFGADTCQSSTDDSQLLSMVKVRGWSTHKANTRKDAQSTSKLLVEMRELAHKVSAGEEKISDETLKILDGINDEMDKILADAVKLHKIDEASVKASRDAIQNCSNKASEDLVVVASLKGEMDNLHSDHNTCRGVQGSEMHNTTNYCNKLQTSWSTDTLPACLGTWPGKSLSSYMDCLEDVGTWQQKRKTAIEEEKKLCDDATKILQAKTTECGNKQDAFEKSTCAWSTGLAHTCSEQDDCRTREIAARDTTHTRVKEDETLRKNQFNAASKIKCYLEVLRSKGDAQTKKLAECESLVPDDKHLNMTYPEVPSETTCDEKPAEKKPCFDEWVDIAYINQGWYNNESYNTFTASTERVSPAECGECVSYDLTDSVHLTTLGQVDCEGSWGEFSTCSKTCGTGQHTRTYSISQESIAGGAACPHSNAEAETEDCNTHTCPVDCKGSWGAFGDCSATCGTGEQTRSYKITQEAIAGGVPCAHTNGEEDSQDCNTQACPVHCEGSWGSWTNCPVTCGSGTHKRTFTVSVEAKHGGKACSHDDDQEQTKHCNTNECPVHCVGSWGAFGACSKTCGSGTQNRNYHISVAARAGGSACPSSNGASQGQACNTHACPSQVIGKTIRHGNFEYATVDNAGPNFNYNSNRDPNTLSTNGCHGSSSQYALPVPSGWEIVPRPEDVDQFSVILAGNNQKYSWSCHCLVFANGQSRRTNNGNNCGNPPIRWVGNKVYIGSCAYRLLIRRSIR